MCELGQCVMEIIRGNTTAKACVGGCYFKHVEEAKELNYKELSVKFDKVLAEQTKEKIEEWIDFDNQREKMETNVNIIKRKRKQ